ncbi:MAG: hypothetical protein AB7G25_11780 [Sphingomonadaceae bacterium]
MTPTFEDETVTFDGVPVTIDGQLVVMSKTPQPSSDDEGNHSAGTSVPASLKAQHGDKLQRT